MKSCTKCKGTFTWKQPYDGTKIPEGENPCNCGKPKQSGAAPKAEIPIEQIVAEITAIEGTIPEESRNAPENIEGKWKYAISRKIR